MLAERAARNAAQVEAAYGGELTNEADAQGPDSEEDMIQEEYENEEQVATVTVVEDLDIDALIHAEPPSERPNPGSSSNQRQHQTRPTERCVGGLKSPATANMSGTLKKKCPSARSFKYEGKAARLAEKKKQHTRKREKASRAGGKQPRSSKKRK